MLRERSAIDVEPIQMDITPANSNLNRIMEIGHRAVTTNEQSPPNHRINPLGPYPQLINMSLPELWHNPSFLASISYIGLKPRRVIFMSAESRLFCTVCLIEVFISLSP
jgi:hypothetical protein